MKKALTLSIVIPAFNEESHLKQCLDDIVKQTVMPDEVIVVNNNSTDKTVDIAKKYDFVKVIEESKPGVRYARDAGFAKSNCDIIGRIDADSQIEKHWCEQVLKTFSDSKVAASTGPCFYYDMPMKKFGLLVDNAIRKGLYGLDEAPVLFGSNMAVRRSVWEKVQPLLCTEGEFFEDYDITIHFRLMGVNIVYDEEMIAGVSSRRLDDDPKTFIKTMGMHTHTFEMHNMKSPIARGGKYIYVTIYGPLKLIRKVYDPKSGKLSLSKAIEKSQPRPSSNI